MRRRESELPNTSGPHAVEPDPHAVEFVRGEPVLITDAPLSYDEQLAQRKKRYLLTMGLRIPFIIGAAVCYQIPWLAVSLLALSVPLPWIAVLIANDGPVRDTKRRRPLEGTISYERAITPVTHVIEADPDDTTR